jgi:hypothetical protein
VTDISPDVRRFVGERIHSVAQLELLLVLRRDPTVEWTVSMASAEMRYPRDWVAEQLLGFEREGLVATGERVELSWRYEPRGCLARIVDELAETFARRPRTVTAMIFADAFRLRGREED